MLQEVGNEFSPFDLFLPEFSLACGRVHNEFTPVLYLVYLRNAFLH